MLCGAFIRRRETRLAGADAGGYCDGQRTGQAATTVLKVQSRLQRSIIMKPKQKQPAIQGPPVAVIPCASKRSSISFASEAVTQIHTEHAGSTKTHCAHTRAGARKARVATILFVEKIFDKDRHIKRFIANVVKL